MLELARIQRWYASQCDGDWEHSHGLQIETLDNPGWHVVIDLRHTELADRSFASVVRGTQIGVGEWVHCRIEADQFVGTGVPKISPTSSQFFCRGRMLEGPLFCRWRQLCGFFAHGWNVDPRSFAPHRPNTTHFSSRRTNNSGVSA